MNQIRKHQYGCVTLSQSKNEARELYQPVKLAQGLSGKKLQDDQRNLTCKLSQPERLTPYGKKGRSCKKNLAVTLSKPERLTPYLKSTQKSCKKDTPHSAKNVRRNLDFNVVSSLKKKTKPYNRKSLLMPPNTIKNTYIKEKQSTFILPEIRCPEVFEELETYSSSAKNVCSNVKKNNATSVIQRALLSVPSTIDESGISIACSPHANLACTLKNKDVQKGLNSDQDFPSTKIRTSPNIPNKLQLSSESNTRKERKEEITEERHSVNRTEKFVLAVSNQNENAQSSSQIVKTTAECVPLSRDTNGPDERVTFRKTDLIALELKLTRIIGRLKEDLSELTAVADMISMINAAGETNDKNEKIRQQTTESLNENAVAVVLEKDNSEAQPLRHAEVDLPLESNKENEENSNNVKCSGSEVKFKARRRSARLMAKSLNSLYSFNPNDSFVNLENELNITHTNSNAKCAPITKDCKTPDMSKYKKINEKPIREYLALKSRMSCLLTPKTPKSLSFSTLGHLCLESGSVKANISNKVLSELHNLYADSPENCND